MKKNRDKNDVCVLFEDPLPPTGPVTLIRKEVLGNFEDSQIVQHGAEFRMGNARHGWRVTLDPDDALWIIGTLKLRAKPSDTFARVVIWIANP